MSWIPSNYGNDATGMSGQEHHSSFNVKLGHTHENKSSARMAVQSNRMAHRMQGNLRYLDHHEAVADSSYKVRFDLDRPGQYAQPGGPHGPRHDSYGRNLRLESPDASPGPAIRRPVEVNPRESSPPASALHDRLPVMRDDDERSLDDEEVNRELMLYLEHGSPAGGGRSSSRKTTLSTAAAGAGSSATPGSNFKFVQEEEQVKRHLNRYRQRCCKAYVPR